MSFSIGRYRIVGYVLIMFMLLFFSACQDQSSDLSKPQEVPLRDLNLLSSTDVQTSLETLVYVLSVIHPGDLIDLEDTLTQEDRWCPEVFEGVANTNAWNDHCENREGTVFEGRSQSLYAAPLTVDGTAFTQFATYISAFEIENPANYLMMNGYGDLSIQEDELWMEMVGTYAVTSPQLSWSLVQQSISLQYSIAEGMHLVNGGISQSVDLPELVASIRVVNLSMNADGVSGELVLQDVTGAQTELVLEGQVQDCVTYDAQEICWDFMNVLERSW